MLVTTLAAIAAMTTIGVQSKNVDYKAGSTTLQGYLAAPTDSEARRPAVIIVHDWNGLDAYEEWRANEIAKLGYVAFAADIYGKGVRPKNSTESGAEARKYYSDNALLRERLKAAVDYVSGLGTVNKKKIAAMGYCFGGMSVIEMARMGSPIAGIASFHGGLKTATPAPKDAWGGKMIVFHANGDPSMTPADAEAFKKEMKAAGIAMEFVGYDVDSHPFTVHIPGQTPGPSYRKEADEDSWSRLTIFLKDLFK